MRQVRLFLFFLTFQVLWLVDPSAAQPRFGVVDLGTLGGTFSRANGINDSGAIVGVSTTSSAGAHAFLYDHGVMKDLGRLPGYALPNPWGEYPDQMTPSHGMSVAGMADLLRNVDAERGRRRPLGSVGSTATGINNSGLIVGESAVTGVPNGHAYLYQAGLMHDIGTLGGNISNATAINDSGSIVGYSEVGSGVHAFLYRNGTMHDLGTIGYEYSNAYAINKNGQIVGGSTRADSIQTAFLYQNGSMIDIGTIAGGSSSYALGINSAGHVVGYSTLPAPGAHAFIYRSGLMKDLGSLGSGSNAYGINDSDQVVGYTLVLSGQNHATLWEDDVLEDLNDMIASSSGWTLQNASAINNHGEIVGYGLHNGLNHAFLLTHPRIEITRPASGQLFVAGETDTIKWNSMGIDSVDILLNTHYPDNATDFHEFMHGIPADSGRYVWNIPDTLLSRRCAIKIRWTSHQEFDTVSNIFRIKGYELTRVTADSNYERFLPSRDGWSFLNSDTAKLWPGTWWNQFDYSSTGVDPYTNSPYPDYYRYIPQQSFPDWPSFVGAFGTGTCYWSTTLGIYVDRALETWGPNTAAYNGSCYGIANSSMLAFDDFAAFHNRFPSIGTYPGLFSNPMDAPTRKALDQSFVYQYGKVARDNDLANVTVRPKTTLARLKEMFLSDVNNHRTLCFFNPAGRGAHQVTPIRIQRDPATSTWMRIYLYNCNSPGTTTDYIIVDTVADQWKEATGFGWGWGTRGMYLDISSSSLIPAAVFSTQLPSMSLSNAGQGGGPLEILTPPTANLRIVAPNGDSLGCVDGAAFSSMTNGVPLIPKIGFPVPPVGYYLGWAEYHALIDSSSDSTVRFSVSGNNTRYEYSRSDASNNQHDLLSFGNGLTMKNPDPAGKSAHLKVVVSSDSSDKSYDLAGWILGHNDSLAALTFNNDDLAISNAGSPKNYALNLIKSSSAGEEKFRHDGILLPANSTQQIVPAWTDLSGPVKIYVDYGSDNTIDDSLIVDNQLTDAGSRTGKRLPASFALMQNYPNPFNPTTTISYALSSQVHVKLTVYNMLGEEVITLVDEVQSPGYKSVPFTATGLPSGVYTYRLTAGSYTDVKRMILVK